MIKRILRTAILTAAALIAISHAGRAGIDIPVFEDSLANGLRVLIVPNEDVAVVSCRLYYFVGGMNEGPGTSGLSHMYEHMMFKGTQRLGTHDFQAEVPYLAAVDSLDRLLQRARVLRGEEDSLYRAYRAEINGLVERQREYIKKDEIWELYNLHGGTALNAWTSSNMTAYIVTLPKNKVELFYWIESDRMQFPVLREFHSEVDVVTEERRMRYDNRPLNRYWERVNALFHVAHPFRQPVIGWEPEIRAFSTDKLMRHINRFYTPDNAVLILVGNIEPERAMSDINKYFGGIPRAAVDREPVVTREPPAIGEVRFTVREDIESRVDVMFQVPGYPHVDLYALDVIEGVLSDRSGRLYRRLVDREGLCTDAGASNTFRLHNGYFHIYATLKKGTDPAVVERIIREEVDKLTREAPTEREILRVSNGIRMQFASGLKCLEVISDRLAAYQRLGSWRDLFEYPDKIAAVDRGSIPGVAAAYLRPDFGTWGFIVPKAQGGK